MLSPGDTFLPWKWFPKSCVSQTHRMVGLPPGLLLHESHRPVPTPEPLHSAPICHERPQCCWCAHGITRHKGDSAELLLLLRMAEDASGQKNLICSSCLPFNYGNPVLELTLSNFEVEKEYPRIDDGILELKWNLKISPEFKYNLLVLSTKH